MGRMEDAMRRAAVDEASPSTKAPAATALAGESFPDESPIAEATADTSAFAEVDTPSPAGDAVLRDDAAGEAPAADELSGHMDPSVAAKTVIDHDIAPASREQYRRLAAACHHAQEATGLKVVMIASAVAGEGKSLTAANLALTLSESYRRSVLLIDADLRRPALHKLFRVESDTGLSDALETPDEPHLTLFELSERLTLLPAGRPNNDPMAGLTSVRMRNLLEEARSRFDWIILDTPPVGALSDANLLAAMVDGVLLVVKAESTPYQLVQRAVEALGSDRVLGAVLNRVSESSLQASYAYYYSYYTAARPGAGG